MLTDEQLRHFAEHGWVVLESLFDAEQCQAYRKALDRCARMRRATVSGAPTEELVQIDNIVFHDDIFLEWLLVPEIQEANRQILGAKLRFQGVNAHIRYPHKDRHTRADELFDPDTWGWHRGMRPKWGIFPHDTDPNLINAAFLNNITYLTPVSERDGSTMVLDGSHRLEGNYASLKDRCPVVPVEAPAGSVLIFTETLIHAGVPILSEQVRYNMYYGFVPPWFRCWPGMEMPKELVDSLADPKLREIFESHNYGGQTPEL